MRRGLLIAVSAGALAVMIASLVSAADEQTAGERMVEPRVPETPGLETDFGELDDGVRTFEVTASEVEHQIANFPIQNVRVWGYNGSTPGPTLIAHEGETVRVELTNDLEHPTTIHFHGMHMPNEDDGVSGISQVHPVPPGEDHVYEFEPGHAGTFAYHAHTNGAAQTLAVWRACSWSCPIKSLPRRGSTATSSSPCRSSPPIRRDSWSSPSPITTTSASAP